MDEVSQFNFALGVVVGSLENQVVRSWLDAQGVKDLEIEAAMNALKALVRAAYR